MVRPGVTVRNSATILLVEDDAIIALAEKKALEKNGFNVTIAQDGEAAIRAMQEIDRFDLVLMDIDLGVGMDGTEAAEIILRDRDVPVVFLSSHSEPEIVGKTEKITSYGYIVKNSGLTVLLASIKMALKLSESRRAEKLQRESLEAVNRTLQKTQRLLEQTARMARVGGWETNVITGEVEWSPVKREIHGMPPDQQPDMEKTINYYREGHDRETIRGLVSRAVERGEPYDVELRIVTDQGRERWVRTMGSAEFEKGRCVRLYGVTQDIDERKRAEASVAERLALQNTVQTQAGLISSLIDSVPDLVFWKDLDGVYLGCNAEFARHLGRPREDIPGKTDYDIYSRQEAEFFRAQDRAMLAEMKPRKNEEWISYPDGRRVLLDTLKTPCRDPEGELIGVLGIARDITDRKATEEELVRQLREKETILRETHHRIKNNMASVASLLEMQMQSSDNAEVVRALQDAAGRVNSIRELYEKMLLTEGTQAVRADHYIGDLADSVAALHAGSSRITMEKDLDGMVLGPKELFPLGIIVNELITNAIKHAFTRPAEGVIRVTLNGTENRVVLVVQDNGVGLPGGTLPARSGGFGTTLVGMLAEQLGGSVRFDSRGGTAVTLVFPAPQGKGENRIS